MLWIYDGFRIGKMKHRLQTVSRLDWDELAKQYGLEHVEAVIEGTEEHVFKEPGASVESGLIIRRQLVELDRNLLD